ncbi:MAG: hypothetical protein WDM90_25160 [Ferruginibacter sp.]
MMKKWLTFFIPRKKEGQMKALKRQSDSWEEDYLVKKIQGKYSGIPEKAIREAVKSCYVQFRSPEPGEKLVKCVISRLNLNEESDFIGLNK